MESETHQEEIISQFTRQSRPFAENQAHSANQSFEVFRELGHFSGTEKVIDVGCGPGLVSHYLSQFVGEVVGIDLTPAMVDLANETALKSKISNASFMQGNMSLLPFPAQHFDAAVTRYTFHHLENPQIAFSEMVRVTRSGGKVIVVDVSPEESKRSSYDTFERLRDPSHTSALISSELETLGKLHGLENPQTIHFGLEMNAERLINSSFPKSIAREKLVKLLSEDIEQNRYSFNARNENGVLMMTFPVAAVGWTI